MTLAPSQVLIDDNDYARRRDSISRKLKMFDELTGQNKMRDNMHVPPFIILPDDPWKIKWDMLVASLVIYISIFTPYRIAFFEDEFAWYDIVDYAIDLLFLLDLVFNCMTAYTNSNQDLVIKRKKIFLNYLTSWFFIDLLAVIPLDLFLSDKDNPSVTHLANLTRFNRFYRLLKFFRLIRMLKVFRNKDKYA